MVHDLWKTKLIVEHRLLVQLGHLSCTVYGATLPKFITDTIGDRDIGDVTHDRLCSSIHQVERPLVVGFLKAISGTELRETPAVYPYHDPRVREEDVGLFKVLDIFKSILGGVVSRAYGLMVFGSVCDVC